MVGGRRSRRGGGRAQMHEGVKIFLFVLAASLIGFLYMVTERQLVPEDQRPVLEPVAVATVAERTKFNATRSMEIERGPARIMLDTGAELRIVASDSLTEVVLYRGRAKFQVRSLQPDEKFRVQTFNAVVGVRGTIFIVDIVEGVMTTVHVEEGLVALETNDGTSLLLGAGESGRVYGATSPRKLSPEAPNDAAATNGVSASNLRRSTYSAEERIESDRGYLYDAAEMQELKKRARQYLEGLDSPPLENPPGMIADRTPGVLEGIELSTFSGNGSWSSVYGFQGPVSIAIDVPNGTFQGKFTGSGRRGDVEGDIAGSFSGRYTGTETEGTMDGFVVFGVSNTAFRREVPSMHGKVRGRLEAGTVHGVFEGAQIDGEFSILVKLKR